MIFLFLCFSYKISINELHCALMICLHSLIFVKECLWKILCMVVPNLASVQCYIRVVSICLSKSRLAFFLYPSKLSIILCLLEQR